MSKQWTQQFNVPVIPQPCVPDGLAADIWGVMPNTPAHAAGLHPADLVLAVNQQLMRTRVEAFQLLKLYKIPY
ncbi:MAG TPA: hypothetical protein VFC74_05845 [Oscillospiraceae bacterium]|nr:hypothetical protein [Oscillospiraceae bacterium]